MGNINSTPQAPQSRRPLDSVVVAGVESTPPGNYRDGRNSRLSRRLSQATNTILSARRHSDLYRPLGFPQSPSPRQRSDHERHNIADSVERESQSVPTTQEEADPEWHSELDPETPSQISSPRRSRMSRLGSRLLPDSVIRGLLNSGEETAEEGRALRGWASDDEEEPALRNRQSISTGETNGPSRPIQTSPRVDLDARSRSAPILETSAPLSVETTSPEIPQTAPHSISAAETQNFEQTSGTSPLHRTASRLRRIRNSVALPFPRLFSRSLSRFYSSQNSGSSSATSIANTPGPDDSFTAHDQTNPNTNDDVHELDSVEPGARHNLRPSGLSSIRRLPPTLRSRSTRLVRRGEHPPLSQVLQLAATAIAAQLSGQTAGSAGNSRPLNGAAFDGSIQNFVQTLQEAATAQAGADFDMNATDGDLPPVNFMRVFQFPNDENGSPIAAADTRDSEANDTNGRHTGDRSVTLVLVGVRSMPHTPTPVSDETGSNVQSLDTLLNLPFLPSGNLLRNASSGAMFRRSDGRTRAAGRRQSLNNYSFPSQYESQRHHRTRPVTNQTYDDTILGTSPQDSLTASPTPISESPPGPIPPPSTPAYVESGRVTPVERPSSSAATPLGSHAEIGEDPHGSRTTDFTDSNQAPARLRHRSDTEFARRPELGSGASRRNGVVEPDHVPAGIGRSWLIYVVGTNVSPDHPAFTMPSLFTDNPSYEDMQMLSTLLGPVKPPVATADDVQSAGGRYRLVLRGGNLVGLSDLSDGGTISVVSGDRCLVCLSEYETGDEVRCLKKCAHVYHQECIDEWLTTGRNSCPMCREQGVEEQQTSVPA